MAGLINALGRQLVDRTESLDLLLRQRSLPRQVTGANAALPLQTTYGAGVT